jgi:hypothetical protein
MTEVVYIRGPKSNAQFDGFAKGWYWLDDGHPTGPYPNKQIAEDKEFLYRNHYECSCGETWADEWYCGCDDECPECGLDISPHQSDNLF